MCQWNWYLYERGMIMGKLHLPPFTHRVFMMQGRYSAYIYLYIYKFTRLFHMRNVSLKHIRYNLTNM